MLFVKLAGTAARPARVIVPATPLAWGHTDDGEIYLGQCGTSENPQCSINEGSGACDAEGEWDGDPCAAACDTCDAEYCAQCNNEAGSCPTDTTETGSCTGEGGCPTEQHCPSEACTNECPADCPCESDCSGCDPECPTDCGGCDPECPTDCGSCDPECPGDCGSCEADCGACDSTCDADSPPPEPGCSSSAWQDANCDTTLTASLGTYYCNDEECGGNITITKSGASWIVADDLCKAAISCLEVAPNWYWQIHDYMTSQHCYWRRAATTTGPGGCPAGVYTYSIGGCDTCPVTVTVA